MRFSSRDQRIRSMNHVKSAEDALAYLKKTDRNKDLLLMVVDEGYFVQA